MRKKISREMQEQKIIAACSVCGKILKENEEVIKDNKFICKSCILIPEKEEKKEEIFNFIPPDGIIKIFIYLISFFNPLIGFLFGAIFYPQKSKENKDLGKKCFILMGLGIAFYLIIFVIFALINLSIGTISDFQFNEGYY